MAERVVFDTNIWISGLLCVLRASVLFSQMAVIFAYLASAAPASRQRLASKSHRTSHTSPFKRRLSYHILACLPAAGCALIDWIRKHPDASLEIATRAPEQPSFHVLPRRWISLSLINGPLLHLPY